VPSIPQAGAIVYRTDDGFLRVLLVRANKDPNLWVLPKGSIDPGESPRIAALREAFEEAGVSGLIVGSAGAPLRFRSGDKDVVVDYFLVELTSEMPSPERREKCWCLVEEAGEKLVFQNARDLLNAAVKKIPAGSAGHESVAR
jgi:8-oxo-dGTP pyrophosphatase MutT (NUDIX family)